MIELKPEIFIDREKVLSAAGCTKESPVYGTVCGEYEKYCNDIETDAKILLDFDGNCIYVLITAGEQISDYSKQLMDSGECLAGLIVNAYADEMVFALDKEAAGYIKKECALKGTGVSERIELSPDTDSETVYKFAEKFRPYGIGVTSALMFTPMKSMGYILKLTDDKNIFKAQHDCSSCPITDCPRRNVNKGSFDILSEYGYREKNSGKCVVCVDIGTTTLAFCMIKSSGEKLEHSEMNTQRRFGADVISRIEAANRGRGRELRELIVFQLIKGIKALLEKSGESPEKIVISGNTVMTHLLMGYPCEGLGKYPFKPHSLETAVTDFQALTGSSIVNSPVIVTGGISAFVGGDIVSGLYMCDFDLSDKVNLFIDLGTNGEMAIGNREKILVTSAAAGPAFEGGRISHGTGSVDGAVCGLNIKSAAVKTINDKPPCGICGTGIIEAVSELIENGLIDETGLLDSRFFEYGYSITDEVKITQQDIREIQTAKSAVCSGIEMLAEKSGFTFEDINKVYLAGGFGYRLNTEKACNMGLIPAKLRGKVEAVGNSSLGGAVKYAFSADGAERIKNIQRISEEFPLAEDGHFNELYLRNMYFIQAKKQTEP